MHQGRLAGARHPRHRGERVQGDADRHVLEVVLTRAGERQHPATASAERRHRDRLAPGDVARGERVRRLLELGLRAVEDDLAAAVAGARPQLDDVIGRGDELAIVLDHHHGVAGLGELPAQVGEPCGITRVQSDGRLVQDVEGADQLRAQLVREVDPLGFAPREGSRLPGEREVAEPDAKEEGELGVELAQDLPRDDRLPRGEPEVSEETSGRVDREHGELGDREPGDADGERGRLEARAVTQATDGLAAIAREEDADVELVAVRLDLFEEPLDAREVPVAAVDELARLRGKLVPRRLGVHSPPPGRLHHLALVPAAGRMRPRLHGAAREAQGAVGHHQRFVVLEHVAEALALRARAERVVEREQERLRALERRAAPAAAEVLPEFARVGADDLDGEPAAALAQRRLDRLDDARPVRRLQHDAVEDYRDRLAVAEIRRRRSGQVEHVAGDPHAGEAAPREIRPELGGRKARGDGEAEGDHRARAGVRLEERVHDRFRRVRDRRRATGRAVDVADLRVEQPQVVVDLGGGADGGARGAHGVLLLERDRGPDLLDLVHVGTVDPIEEHPSVRRQ